MSEFALVQVRPLPGERIEPGEEQTIGRERCDVMLDHPLVSRRHAVLRPADGRLVIEDLGSRNGTFVNNERLAEPRELAEGDEVMVGETVWRVETAAAATMVGEVPAHESGVFEATGMPTSRGDVPPPRPSSVVAPALVAQPVAAGAPALAPATPFNEASEPKRRVSAARRLEATIVSYAVVAATAAAVVTYLATR